MKEIHKLDVYEEIIMDGHMYEFILQTWEKTVICGVISK